MEVVILLGKVHVISLCLLLFTLLTVPPPLTCSPFVSVSVAAESPVKLPEERITADTEEEDKLLLSPGTLTVIKPQEMKGEQKNLPELLKMIPGLHIIEAKGRGAYTVASVRGSTAAEVSVFVDGILMNLGSEAAVDLSAIPVENVERIEVYRGYIPARFSGASMGGVINIITKRLSDPGGAISLGVGSYGKFKTNLSYGIPLGDGNFFFGANYERTDGDFEYWNDNNTPYSPEKGYEANRQNNGYRNTDFLMKWNNENWFVRGAWKKNDRELPYAAPGADKPTSLPGATLNTEQTDFSVERRQTTGKLDWGIKADYIYQDKKYDNPYDAAIGGWGETHNRYKTNRFGIAADGTLPVGDNHLLEFMANFSREELDVTGDIVSSLGGLDGFSREEWNLQMQDTISLNKTGDFWLTPILRYNTSDGDGDFSWGLALTKKIGDAWTVKVSGGSYNRAPNLYERYGDGASIRPNPTLKWEEGWQWDAGVTWTGNVMSADVAVTATVFGRKADNLIEYVMTSPRYGVYQNIGKAEIFGVEIEQKTKWKDWELFFSGTWMDAKNTTDNDYRKNYQLPNRPEWESLLRLTRSRLFSDKTSCFVELHYTGNNYFDDAERIEMDDLFTVGLGFKYLFSDRANLVVGVDDIFDKAPDTCLVPTGNGPTRTLWYPLQGRTFYATLTWLF